MFQNNGQVCASSGSTWSCARLLVCGGSLRDRPIESSTEEGWSSQLSAVFKSRILLLRGCLFEKNVLLWSVLHDNRPKHKQSAMEEQDKQIKTKSVSTNMIISATKSRLMLRSSTWPWRSLSATLWGGVTPPICWHLVNITFSSVANLLQLCRVCKPPSMKEWQRSDRTHVGAEPHFFFLLDKNIKSQTTSTTSHMIGILYLPLQRSSETITCVTWIRGGRVWSPVIHQQRSVALKRHKPLDQHVSA